MLVIYLRTLWKSPSRFLVNDLQYASQTSWAKIQQSIKCAKGKKNEEKNKQLENGKQNLTFRKANLVFESPTAEIIHMPLLSTFQSYNIQTKQNFKSLFTKRKKCRNILVWITIFRYSLPVSQVSMIHNHFIWILYPCSVQVAIGRHLKKFSSKRTLNNNGICPVTSSSTFISLPKIYFMEGKCNERFQMAIGYQLYRSSLQIIVISLILFLK